MRGTPGTEMHSHLPSGPSSPVWFWSRKGGALSPTPRGHSCWALPPLIPWCIPPWGWGSLGAADQQRKRHVQNLFPGCSPDPLSMGPQKALETIGANLQKQYENWQPRVSAVPGPGCLSCPPAGPEAKRRSRQAAGKSQRPSWKSSSISAWRGLKGGTMRGACVVDARLMGAAAVMGSTRHCHRLRS